MALLWREAVKRFRRHPRASFEDGLFVLLQRLGRRLKEEHGDFETPTEARASVLADTLLEAYCILREAPEKK